MNIRSTVFFIAAAVIASTGCGGGQTNTNVNVSTNVAVVNTNTEKANAANPLGVTTPTPEATTNDAPTLTPVVRAFYDALKKKDDAALKQVLSQDFIARVQSDMKDEKRTDMAGFMAELDRVPDKPVEVRNEKIQGDKAVAEIKGGTYVNWTPFAFIREDGQWKFTGGSPALDNVAK